VTKHCVAFADEALHGLQLGTLYILTGGFVSKCFVQGHPFELAELVLIQGADAQVADPFTGLTISGRPYLGEAIARPYSRS